MDVSIAFLADCLDDEYARIDFPGNESDFPPDGLGDKHLTDIVDTEGVIKIQFDYPLRSPVIFDFHHEGGFTLDNFLYAVGKGYKRIYDEEDQGQRAPTCAELGGFLLNRVQTDGPYGIWGHVIEDLVIVGMDKREGVWHLDICS